TEHIRTEERVAWMAFPRAAAIAELGWSSAARRDWRDFVRRVAALFARYDELQISHADSAFAVHARISPSIDHAPARVELSTQAGYGDIRFTLDGSAPAATSPRYERPIAAALD